MRRAADWATTHSGWSSQHAFSIARAAAKCGPRRRHVTCAPYPAVILFVSKPQPNVSRSCCALNAKSKSKAQRIQIQLRSCWYLLICGSRKTVLQRDAAILCPGSCGRKKGMGHTNAKRKATCFQLYEAWGQRGRVVGRGPSHASKMCRP